jgi:hypothetical protein
MNIPKYFKNFSDVKEKFTNIITTYCSSFSEGGFDYEGLPESIISDFYIVTKNDNKYIIYKYHSENWFGGEPEEETYFYHESSSRLCKKLYSSNKILYRALKNKIDKNKEPELYDIICHIIGYKSPFILNSKLEERELDTLTGWFK